MPEPYEWVDEPAFTTTWDHDAPGNVMQFRALQFTSDRHLADTQQKGFEASYGLIDGWHIDPEMIGAVDFWQTAVPGVGSYTDELEVHHGSAWTGTAYEPDRQYLRSIGFLNIRLGGDLGAVDVDALPPTPEGMFLEIEGGGVQSITLAARVQAIADGYGPHPPQKPWEDPWLTQYGQWHVVLSAAGARSPSAVLVSTLADATPANVEFGWEHGDSTGVRILEQWGASWGTQGLDPTNHTLDQYLTVDAPYRPDLGTVLLLGPAPLHEQARQAEDDPAAALRQQFEDVTGVATRAKVMAVQVHGVNHSAWRWRWVPQGTGLTRLRQRQTLTGSDSWPLRQRQSGGHSGSWSLRQRQSGV